MASGFNPSKSVTNQMEIESQQRRKQTVDNKDYKSSMTPYIKGAQ